MKPILAMVFFSSAALTYSQLSLAQSAQSTNSEVASSTDKPAGSISKLPAPPQGRSTIMGGAIRNVDPVRDQFSLVIVGEKPMKILFDERTQVFRDGVRIPLRDLRTEDHASVQTVLDGADVFAVSIHILSQTPQGECQGQVASYNPATGELSVISALSPEPVNLIVPANTLIARAGQSSFSEKPAGFADLAPGTLVSVKFSPASRGPAIANQITVLAVPGSQFLLAGDVSFLDLSAGQLDLVDPRDEKSYQIYFDATRIPAARKLHLGDHVRIAATYQANRYEASDISVY